MEFEISTLVVPMSPLSRKCLAILVAARIQVLQDTTPPNNSGRFPTTYFLLAITKIITDNEMKTFPYTYINSAAQWC